MSATACLPFVSSALCVMENELQATSSPLFVNLTLTSLSFILINPCSHLKATFDLRSATSECSVFTFIEFRLVECYKQVYWVIYIYCQCTNKLLCSHLDSLSRFSQSNELVICNHHTLIYITFPQTVTSCTHCWPYSAYNKDSPT